MLNTIKAQTLKESKHRLGLMLGCFDYLTSVLAWRKTRCAEKLDKFQNS